MHRGLAGLLGAMALAAASVTAAAPVRAPAPPRPPADSAKAPEGRTTPPAFAPTPRSAGSIRPGFVETVVADSLDSPVSMAIGPRGEILVCEQGGRLRLIRDGRLRARPSLTVPVYVNLEEGLLGVAFDPHFASTRRIYLVYTSGSPVRHNVVARCVVAGDTAIAASLETIFELDPHLGHQHVGGAIRFGTDGMLYVGTGDNDRQDPAQSLHSTFGKILRIRPDGGIPKDNPFTDVVSGRDAAIWARGLRNAFTFDIHPRTGRMFINDVGGGRFEEVNDGVAGANYGWPLFEGPSHAEGYRSPIHAYGHDRGCAITGGAFYAPRRMNFPAEWKDRYFFSEYCANEIRWLDPAHPDPAHVFGVTRVPGPVDLRVGPEGALYYLVRGNSDPVGGDHTSRGMVVRVAWSGKGAR